MRKLIAMSAVTCLTAVAGWSVNADPVDDTLVVDGVEMVSRTKAPEGHPLDEIHSGWLYRTDETRALQTDSFQNPGMLGIEQGEEIWNTVEGEAGKSCASCHNDASESMKGVGAAYPKWNAKAGKPYNLELQINDCRVNNMKAEPYKFDDANQIATVAYIRHQSHSMPVKLDLSEGDMQAWWEKGKEAYYRRTGQLNLSCASCHEENYGNNIRADHLSQGQLNGFPTYRLKQGRLISVHNRFRGCIRDTRATQPDAFSDVLMALEVYVTWRATGLSVETPAIRN